MGTYITYCWPIAQFAIESSELDYREVYGKGIEEDAYEKYMNRSKEKLDAFATAHSWTANMVDEIILPDETRKKIIEALEMTKNKKEELPPRAKMHTSPPT